MYCKTKSNIYLILKKRKKKVINQKHCSFDFQVALKYGHNKFYVIEKLGSVDYNNRIITINIFRLVFWLSNNVAITYKAAWFLFTFLIYKND